MAARKRLAQEQPQIEKRNIAAHIYCTLTNNTDFVEWKQGPDMPYRDRFVTIFGGAGVARKRSLITPYGTKTDVDAEQLEFLESNRPFQQAVKDGWIKVVKATGWKVTDADIVAADMAQRDGSAPLVPNDYIGDEKAPTFGAKDQSGTPPTTMPRSRPVPGRINNSFR